MTGNMRSMCIGCACDEQHACEHGDTGCWWLRYDGDSGMGVCSRCEDLVPEWDAGQRIPRLDLIAERFVRQLQGLYDEATAREWMDASQPLFDGASARVLILAAGVERVRAVVFQMLDGAYI